MSASFRNTELGKAFYKFVNLHFSAVQADTTEDVSYTSLKKAWAASNAAQEELVNMLTTIAEQEKYV